MENYFSTPLTEENLLIFAELNHLFGGNDITVQQPTYADALTYLDRNGYKVEVIQKITSGYMYQYFINGIDDKHYYPTWQTAMDAAFEEILFEVKRNNVSDKIKLNGECRWQTICTECGNFEWKDNDRNGRFPFNDGDRVKITIEKEI